MKLETKRWIRAIICLLMLIYCAFAPWLVSSAISTRRQLDFTWGVLAGIFFAFMCVNVMLILAERSVKREWKRQKG